jgi:iron complex transport system substrate-binding protein
VRTVRRRAGLAVLAGLLTVTTLGAGGSPSSDRSFPRTVTADQGEVTIGQRPTRIVSLSPSLTEMLFAIGAGKQVIAVDEHSDHPARTPKTDLSGFRPNLEAIAGYEPDLVVLASDRTGIVDALGGIDIPVLVLGSADHLRDVYRQIRTLGAATGHDSRADAVAKRMQHDIDEAVESLPKGAPKLRYFYELSDVFHTVSSNTFIGELLARAGLVSIAGSADAASGGFPQLSAEAIIAADPDVVFLAHTDGTELTRAQVAQRPGWDSLRAVRKRHVIQLDVDLAARWGPRIVDLLESVVDATKSIDRR